MKQKILIIGNPISGANIAKEFFDMWNKNGTGRRQNMVLCNDSTIEGSLPESRPSERSTSGDEDYG